MNKGLEALEKLHRHSYNDMLEKIGCFKTIEKELKRLEELEIMYSNCVIEATKQKKTLEIIKHHLSEQVANIELGKPQKCLLMLIMENDENYDLLKEVLL